MKRISPGPSDVETHLGFGKGWSLAAKVSKGFGVGATYLPILFIDLASLPLSTVLLQCFDIYCTTANDASSKSAL